MDQVATFEASIGPQSGTTTIKETNIIYPPLPVGCIRILHILPATLKQDICCRMETFSLSQPIEFMAISYTWGAAPAQHTIQLNGIQFKIRKNLWRFLSQARSKSFTTSNLLWIDALCINQASLIERTRQVSLMPQIYQAALRVLVWLGPAYSESDRAFVELARHPSYWQTKKKMNSIFAKSAGAAIQGLCERPYWHRLWIFQELMLAQQVDVMCGSRVIPLANLKSFLIEASNSVPNARQKDRPEYNAINNSSASSIIQQTAALPNQTSLWDLMLATQHLRCAEQRDKVFALLGVASVQHQNIYPDYTMPMPTLMNTVLRNQHQRARPRGLQEVQDQCRTLAAIVGVDDDVIFAFDVPNNRTRSPRESEMAALPLRWRETQISLWWTRFYSHSVIEELLLDENIISPFLLCSLAEKGDASGVKLLLDTGRVDANWQGEDEWNPILLAVQHEREAFVKVLLDSGRIDWSVRRKQETLLLFTAREGNATISNLVMDAVRDHVDVNARTSPGTTPLYMVANFRNTVMVERLLALSRVDVDLRREDWTPLHVAANQGWDDIVKLMLNSDRVDVNTKRGDGWTPLHLATHHGKNAVVKVMLDSPRLDLTCATHDGMTVLHTAVAGGHPEITKLLLAYPVDVNARHSDGLTALHTAAARDRRKVTQLLLNSNRFDVNARNDTGWTPLHLAAMNGHDAIVQQLLALDRTDRDPASVKGRTPLHLAAEHGRTNVVQILLGLETMDVNARLSEGKTPLHQAVEGGHQAATRLLLDARGIEVNAESAAGTPLHLAARHGRTVLAMLLLGKPGIEVDLLNHDRFTPLLTAVRWGHAATARLLLDAGSADINLKGRGGYTPLHVAAEHNHEGVVGMLLEFDRLDVNAKNDQQGTALHTATEYNSVGVVKLLLNDPRTHAKARRDDGADAYWQAMYLKHWDIVELLWNRGA